MVAPASGGGGGDGVPAGAPGACAWAWAAAANWAACSLVIATDWPHIVHVVRYRLARGITGTKNRLKKVRTRTTAWAAGVWQSPHTAKTVAKR